MVAATLTFVVSAARYPGGYDWANQSISSLFQPVTAAGFENSARPLAVVAVLLFCVGVAAAFQIISTRVRTRFHHKTIQITGIGSMVYAFLVVTPMHDLLVGIALLLFLIAMLATFHMLFLDGRLLMLLAGMVCLSGTLWNATMYYGGWLLGFLPLVQKGAMLLWVA